MQQAESRQESLLWFSEPSKPFRRLFFFDAKFRRSKTRDQSINALRRRPSASNSGLANAGHEAVLAGTWEIGR